jgi:hypothetical protein
MFQPAATSPPGDPAPKNNTPTVRLLCVNSELLITFPHQAGSYYLQKRGSVWNSELLFIGKTMIRIIPPLDEFLASSDHGLTQEPHAFLRPWTKFEPNTFSVHLNNTESPHSNHVAGTNR